MRLTLRQLQIFQAVARAGSTSAAAAKVALSQSATSAALNELERALATLLFDRVGKRLLVNDSGRALLPMALAVLDGAQSIETAFAAATGFAAELQIFASTTIGNYVLPALLARGAHAARVNLRIGNTADVIHAVLAFETDLGFIEGPCQDPGLRVSRWLEDELVIIAAPTHPLTARAARAPLAAASLMKANWLLREAGSGTREAVEQALAPHLVNLASTMTLASSEAIKNAVAEGLGVSCLSRAVVQDLVQAGRLVILPTRLPRLSRRFSLIQHRHKVMSKSLLAFLTYCEGYRP